jgi:hypothetical protein
VTSALQPGRRDGRAARRPGTSSLPSPAARLLMPAQLEQPHLYAPYTPAPHPPFAFALCVAGFRARGALADALFARAYATPTLHVLGRTDVLVVPERAQTLLDVSAGKRVVWHDGGACCAGGRRGGADGLRAQDTLCRARRRGARSSRRTCSTRRAPRARRAKAATPHRRRPRLRPPTLRTRPRQPCRHTRGRRSVDVEDRARNGERFRGSFCARTRRAKPGKQTGPKRFLSPAFARAVFPTRPLTPASD